MELKKGFWSEGGMCKEISKRNYENILGLHAEITEKEYWHFLECLPPLKYEGNGFYMSEFLTGNLTHFFYKKDGKFFCEVREFKGVRN